MSRQAFSLYGQRERHAQSDGLEGFIAEGGFAYQDDSHDSNTVARFLAVLLNFDAGPHPVSFVQELAASMKNVLEHCFCVPWPDVHRESKRLLEGFAPAVVNVVVRLPARSRLEPDALRTVNSTLAALVGSGGHRPGVVVGICANPHEWVELTQLRHFVAADLPYLERDTCALFKTVASMMAPVAIVEWDEEDLAQGLGDAHTPARLAHAVWEQEAEQLRFLSTEDGLRASEAPSVFVSAFLPDASINTTKKLMDAYRKQAGQGRACFSVTSGFFRQVHWLAHDSSHVVTICRQAANP
ncbi:hypothetical protein HHL11_19425 [Ramlibacter sp. G-1-2-2]|uniref:Uncharacterized protein n=1 Tax=Ramlibacter agri TaxID=2728837 RepID=A0A848H8U6_9BURK|nr:hypothetical protein [Ramlibacter agri]NML45929.1 hypothetical protein [Ramlibacter agri]